MPIRLIIISLAVFVAASAKGLCEQKTFTETVRVVMGSRETQEEAREYALLETKRCLTGRQVFFNED